MLVPEIVTWVTDLDHASTDPGTALQNASKVIIAFFIFGIALDTHLADFRDVVRRPGVIAVGLVAQYLVAPALTLALTLALDVRGSVAIGMLLVACCPAGNLSNILTHRARGDVALSISMTGTSNVLAVAVTPVALAFWSSLNPAADALLTEISLDPWEMVGEVALLIGLPFAAGLFVAWKWPAIAARGSRFVEPAALAMLLLIIVGGLATKGGTIITYAGVVTAPILLQNAIALATGYGTGRALRLPVAGTRAMTFELGVRNTALALVLALAFFGELGGVILVAALWGLWDVITGLALATWWRRRTPTAETTEEPARSM
ncbi:bile acid:sodium symporter family protein [Nocardioides sp. GY 10113]|uniref:bile acid:sodium symporter family protein n=1 Tax=Nocardioides sp. GY 10113 TaxID=2569761 RepID=UPI0010A8DCD2|nr:bile acid:sodium symporter family protein [Nocardioides sp. GY 10113]TIC87495.1 bile acid:sodium symporter family protein [Nocardioides sp. GY 10113]